MAVLFRWYSTSRRRARNAKTTTPTIFLLACKSAPSSRSQLIAPQRHNVVRLRRNPLKCGLNRLGQGFRLEWFLEQQVIAQIAPKARQIRITAGEQHLEA